MIQSWEASAVQRSIMLSGSIRWPWRLSEQ